MALTQRGIVYKVGNTESRQYKDKTFVSRELILEQPRFDSFTGEKLSSNYISFEATKEDTCKALDNFPQGSKVEVEFICRGSLFQKKDKHGYDVSSLGIKPYGAIECIRYDGMEQENRQLVCDFTDFIVKHNLTQYLKERENN